MRTLSIMDLPDIKHLVFSGGAIWGFSSFGILYQALETGFIKINLIESIYGTSVGTVIGLTFCLKIDHHTVKDYLIQRPWENVCKKSMHSVLEIFDSKGVFQKTFFIEFFKPLLKSVDLDVNITMRELYEYCGIDFHLYVTELNSFELIDISHTTHPDWEVLDAVYASCCVPFVFSPMIKENMCYVDGGFFMNYPISKCLEHCSPESIFGISLGSDFKNMTTPINAESNILDLLNVLVYRMIQKSDFFRNEKTLQIPYSIHFFLKETTIDYCINVLHDKTERETLICNGIEQFNKKYDEWFSKSFDEHT